MNTTYLDIVYKNNFYIVIRAAAAAVTPTFLRGNRGQAAQPSCSRYSITVTIRLKNTSSAAAAAAAVARGSAYL